MSVRKIVSAFIFLCLFSVQVFAFIPPLEREISLQTSNESIPAVFEKIQQLAQVNFSYPASLVASLSPVSVNLKNKTIREVLVQILPASILVKQKNNYILLRAKPVEKTPETKKISGYVVDQSTQQKVSNVTVYDKASLQSVTTDDYGYYEITLPVSTESISINKVDFKDTVVSVAQLEQSSMLNFTIQPQRYFERMRDSLHIKEKLSVLNEKGKHLMSNFSGYINSLNVRDSLVRDLQVSFVPFVGTNHNMSGAVYNRTSFNILGGYAKGLNGFEVAGLFNLEKEHVNGIQIAGVFNVVGGSAKGVQIAGCLNNNKKSGAGLQVAGLMNNNAEDFAGSSFAGLMTVSKKHSGVSASGLLNTGRSLNGAYFAGLANLSDSAIGFQVAGLMNVCSRSSGVAQFSGLCNINRHGTSLSQISGFYNRTSFLKGIQVGIINVADSAKGLPIGLLSIVKHGVHQLELSADEWFPLSIGFRTGANAFYNIFSAGARASNKGTLWHVTYGVGSSLKLNDKWKFDFSATVGHVSQNQLYFAASDLYRFYFGVEYKPAKKFSIALGPQFNYYITDAITPEYSSTYREIMPIAVSSRISSYGFAQSNWLGGRLALRFF